MYQQRHSSQLTPAAQRVVQGGGFHQPSSIKIKSKETFDDARSVKSEALSVGLGELDLPSFTISGLGPAVAKLEARCNFLEERNAWLTDKLMAGQKKFIQKTMATGRVGKMRRSFEGWRDAMKELRLERQLDEQTRSLDQCQNVAKELGAALSQEQHLRADAERQRRTSEAQLREISGQKPGLQAQEEKLQGEIDILQKHIREAENCLVRSAAEAQNLIDTAQAYEIHARELEHSEKNPAGKGQQDLMEWSRSLREEAHGVMRGVQPLLEATPGSPQSMQR